LVDVWLGDQFDEVIPLMQILLVVLLLQVLVMPSFVVRQALGRLRSHAVLTVVWVVLSIPLTVFLVSRYGLVGAALGPLLPQVLLLPGFLLADGRRMLGEYWSLPLREMAVVSGVFVLLLGGSSLAASHSSSAAAAGYVLVLIGLVAGVMVLIRGRRPSAPAQQGAVLHG
jgi:O-antigen/teichoic acid export membrane protein